MTPVESYASSVETLRRVAVHIVARARQQATGRFGLRATPGGFGTPEFGSDLRRVRVSGGLLIVEVGAADGARCSAMPIDGATLSVLAAFVGVDLDRELSVGGDTPAVGPTDIALVLDDADASRVAATYSLTMAVLDRTIAGVAEGKSALPQLWPEHFDLGVDFDAGGGRRVNLGGSPGDGFSTDPYLYVGPWGTERPGDSSFWNAPFGAVLAVDAFDHAEDGQVGRGVEFFRQGLAKFAR